MAVLFGLLLGASCAVSMLTVAILAVLRSRQQQDKPSTSRSSQPTLLWARPNRAMTDALNVNLADTKIELEGLPTVSVRHKSSIMEEAAPEELDCPNAKLRGVEILIEEVSE